MAEWVGDSGRVEIFDIQQEMLDHTMRRAAERGLANVVPTQGNAESLPYEDHSFDAAVLTTVLGEIPDQDAAVLELKRVLQARRAAGRRRAVRRPAHGHAGRAQGAGRGGGLRVRAHVGPNPLGYFARFGA